MINNTPLSIYVLTKLSVEHIENKLVGVKNLQGIKSLKKKQGALDGLWSYIHYKRPVI